MADLQEYRSENGMDAWGILWYNDLPLAVVIAAIVASRGLDLVCKDEE